jgi:MYXO-CTERM domain-containing protein
MKRTTLTAIAAVTAAAVSAAASADLTGTTMDLVIEQSGFAGGMVGPTGGTHTYGGLDTFLVDQSTVSWSVSSPAAIDGYDNALLLDFTNFQYTAFHALGPSTSTLAITGLAEDAASGSLGVFLPSDHTTDIAQFATATGNSINIGWDVETVTLDDPIHPSVIVAWNSVPVPGPGAVALLGLAGVTACRRRRS